MRVLLLAAEAAPLVKVGGLADVAGSLPEALPALGHDLRGAIPGYGAIDWAGIAPTSRARLDVRRAGGIETAEIFEATVDGVAFVLVTGPPIPRDGRIYGSGMSEDGPKFLFFSLAALWASQALGWKPDVVHANDWHTAAAVYWLATAGRRNDFFASVASLFTIHNLPYRGEGAGRFLGEYGLPQGELSSALPAGLRDSLLALGLVSADILTTVSPTYAREIVTPEGGYGLDGILRARQERLSGVLNGIDPMLWNPETDSALAARYGATTLARRGANKKALQQEALLAPEARPLLAMVTRLDPQKGLDIAAPAVRRWLESGGQFILLGTGRPEIEREFAQLELSFPGRASVRLRFDPVYARRIYGGADMLLIPSRYEPCGLTQMIAMRYGAVPVARRTGGLADTITDAAEPVGTGFLFDEYSPPALWSGLERALRVYADPKKWRQMQRRGMRSDFSWSRPAARYSELYGRAREIRGSA